MTDRELMQKALVHMGVNQHAVADQAPHRDVMAYNKTMDELRAALEQPKSKGYTRAQLNEFEQMQDGTWEADRNG